MYREHKFLLTALFIISAVVTYLFDFRYVVVASDVIGVASIASAIYLAVYAGIQSSSKLKKALLIPDRKIPHKTELGVINAYIKYALVISILSIIISILVLLLEDRFFDTSRDSSLCVSIANLLKQCNMQLEHTTIMVTFEKAISILGIGMLSINFATMCMIGKFMVNRIPYDS